MKFLVAIDGSLASHHALEQAIRLGKPCNATLLLLMVSEPINSLAWPAMLPTGEPLPLQMITPAELDQANRAIAHAQLEKSHEICVAASVKCEMRLEIGSPRTTICEIAEREAVDLLIVGSRGLGNVQRLVLGSVSDYVIHHAQCPVLVVR
jgi:nucleotide-binding universal stress UspA family protein